MMNNEIETVCDDTEIDGELAHAVGVLSGEWPHTMDAHVWAKQWQEHIERTPTIPRDEECMIGWFANAIMAGYDAAQLQAQSTLEVDEFPDIDAMTPEQRQVHLRAVIRRALAAQCELYDSMTLIEELQGADIDGLGTIIADFCPDSDEEMADETTDRVLAAIDEAIAEGAP